jgi:hypothetical protein
MKKKRLLPLVVVLLLMTAAVYASGKTVNIQKITLLIDGQPAEPEMLSLTGLKPGDDFSEFKVDQALNGC